MSLLVNEIRLFEDEKRQLWLECPQNFLIRLVRHLNSRGFKYGAPKIIARDKNDIRNIVKFVIEDKARADTKVSIRRFLSDAKIKFTENSDTVETVFHLVNKSTQR